MREVENQLRKVAQRINLTAHVREAEKAE